jgi:hypothetical protein
MAQWRVFQTKVPANIEKPPAQAEGEKRGAAYIRARSAPPVGDPSQAVRDIYPAAEALAASLGEPAKPVAVEDKDAVIAALRAGNRAKDGQLDAWKAFGRKYAGLPLEGTGINLAGPVGLLGLVAVVAACIACPALGYAVLRVLPLLWGYFRRTTQAVNELAQSNPDAADKLKARLSSRLDLAHKKLVGRWAKQAKPVAT